jgi:O-antigen ligase
MFAFVLRLVANLRQAILIGLVFTTLTLGALPRHLLPINGVAFALQMGFVALALSYLLVRHDTARAIPCLHNGYTVLLFLLFSVVFMYLLISDNLAYGSSVVVWFFIKSMLPLLALGALAPFNREDTRLIFYAVVAGSLLTTLSLFSWEGTQPVDRFSLGEDASPISVGRTIGLGAMLLLLYALLSTRIRLAEFLPRVLLAGILLFAVSLTGSRGPLVSAIFATLAGLLLVVENGIAKRLQVIFILGIVVSLAVAVLILPQATLDYPGITRIVDRFTTFGSNLSDRTRLQMFELAWQGFVASDGLGVGTGGYASMRGIEGRDYPHNVILEVAVGQGIVGLVVLIPLFVMTLIRLVRTSRSQDLSIHGKALLGLWFYGLFNSMVSMDLAGNYALWIAGGLVWMLGCRDGKPPLVRR